MDFIWNSRKDNDHRYLDYSVEETTEISDHTTITLNGLTTYGRLRSRVH